MIGMAPDETRETLADHDTGEPILRSPPTREEVDAVLARARAFVVSEKVQNDRRSRNPEGVPWKAR